MSAKPIVAASDGSEESLRAVDWAAREAVLRGAPLRIVSAPGLLPRMVSSQGHSDYETVSDVIRDESDYALTAATARNLKTTGHDPTESDDTERFTLNGECSASELLRPCARCVQGHVCVLSWASRYCGKAPLRTQTARKLPAIAWPWAIGTSA